MKIMKTLFVFCMLTISSFSFFSCQRETSSSGNKARIQIYLTDDPGDYEAVVIDVKEIKINYSSDSSRGWEPLPGVIPGKYDIIRLLNGKDTLLADAEINTGKIEQIRLVLGPENYIKLLSGPVIPLQTPSAQQSGLKLNIHQDVVSGITYKLLLDFDAARSVVKTGNNKYILKPVIRTSLKALGGTIRGFVLPDSVKTAVFALRGPDTVGGTYTYNGSYMLKALNEGPYDLVFAPTDTTFKKQTKTGIVVTTNSVTTVDTVKLVK